MVIPNHLGRPSSKCLELNAAAGRYFLWSTPFGQASSCSASIARWVGRAEECQVVSAGLAMSTYEGSEQLKNFFVVTSLSSDRRDAVYISTMEARKVRTRR